MRTTVAFSSVCALSLSLVASAFAATKIDHSDAPADEYFGPQKMSALSIRMRIDELGRRYHARTISDGDLVHDASLADTAMHAWHDRYPRDSWLAPTAFHLEQLYQVVQSQEARAAATAELRYIVTNFGTTKYAHLSRLRLAQGFPALNSETTVLATPNPYASAGATALPSASAGATALPSASPGAAGNPTASPASTPTGSPTR